MGDVDPEDAKSLDSNDGAALAGDENHSSNSDMVHLEREEAEMLEEAAEREEKGRRTGGEEEEDDDEMQTSVLSVLGGERELVALREEEEEELRAPETEEVLVSTEEPRREKEPVEFRHVVPPMALPPLPIVKLHPPSATSTPVPSTTTSEAEELYPHQGLLPPSILSAMAAEPPATADAAGPEQLKFSQIPLSDEHSEKESQAAPEKPEPEEEPSSAPVTKPLTSTEMLCGGAALVAVVGVVAYGAVVYCRK
ncbi:unnamed protein product [Ophioblennius macclurei]